MAQHAKKWALVMVGVLFALLLATNIGAFPEIQSNAGYVALAQFVCINTIGFALLAFTKLGYRLGLAST